MVTLFVAWQDTANFLHCAAVKVNDLTLLNLCLFIYVIESIVNFLNRSWFEFAEQSKDASIHV